MNSLTITLSLPAKELSPNYSAWTHGKKMAKARQKKLAEEEAWAATKEAIGRRNNPMWEKASLQATFYFATNRGRDMDNANASLKKHQDGIAMAGLVTNDKVITPLPPVMLIDKDRPRVEITITKGGTV
jgi:hypothetical protein